MEKETTQTTKIFTNSLTSDEGEHLILKTKPIKNKQLKTLNESATCPICLTIISGKSTILTCKHIFCSDCLSTWIKTNKQKETTCPSCRQEPTLFFTTNENGGISNMLKKKRANNEIQQKINICEKCKLPINKLNELLKCQICPRSYHNVEPCTYGYNKSEYKNNVFICHLCYNLNFSDFSYVCELCKIYTTKTKANYERHKENCKKFTCSLCSLVFYNARILNKHQKIHNKEEETNKKIKKINDKFQEIEQPKENMEEEDYARSVHSCDDEYEETK